VELIAVDGMRFDLVARRAARALAHAQEVALTERLLVSACRRLAVQLEPLGPWPGGAQTWTGEVSRKSGGRGQNRAHSHAG